MTGTALAKRITQQLEQMSPKERQLAEFLLTHEAELAIYSSADMARLANVSKPVVSRFFKRLGYQGFYEVRESLRQSRTSGSPQFHAPAQNDFNQWLLTQQAQEQRNIEQTLQALLELPMETITRALLESRRVVIIGLRNSYPVALHWREQLVQMRQQVSLAPQPGQTIAEELAALSEEDLVIMVALRRRPRSVKALMKFLAQSPAQVLLLSDPSGLELAKYANWTMPCHQLSAGGFASYASAMSLVSILCNRALNEHHQPRIEQIDALFNALDELEPPAGS